MFNTSNRRREARTSKRLLILFAASMASFSVAAFQLDLRLDDVYIPGNLVAEAATPAPAPASSAAAPTLTLSVSTDLVAPGAVVTLSWRSTNSSTCTATNGWTGTKPITGSQIVGPLTTPTTYSLTCNGPGGSITATRTIGTTTNPAPTVQLRATTTTVLFGAVTTLNWSSTNATRCVTGGAWSGIRPVSGSEVAGPLTQQTTFSISCSGSGGTAVTMVSVGVRRSISLNWVAPTKNVDGSPLIDLAAYRVYYGRTPGVYSNSWVVQDPNSSSTSIVLPSGQYYFAMTALDRDGNESTYSNQILKTVP